MYTKENKTPRAPKQEKTNTRDSGVTLQDRQEILAAFEEEDMDQKTKQQLEARPMRQIAKDSQVNILEKILELQKDGIDL